MTDVYHSLIWGGVIVIALFMVTSCQQKQPRVMGECKLVMAENNNGLR